MSWKPWKLDVATELKAEVGPKFIKLHPMMMELVVSIDAKSETALKSDKGFMTSMIALCKNNSKTAVQKMQGVLKHADKTAAGFTTDPQMASLFLRPIHMEMEKYFDEGCEDIQKDVSDLFAKKKKDPEYLKMAVKIDLALKFDGLEIPQKGGENKKKVMAGGAVKLGSLDVDLDQDIDVAAIKKHVTEASRTGKDIVASLDEIAELIKQDTSKKNQKDTLNKERQDIEKGLEEAAAAIVKADEYLKKLAAEDKQARKSDDQAKAKEYKAKKEAEKTRLEAVKAKLDAERALEEKHAAAGDARVKAATSKVNTLIAGFQDAVQAAVEKWKQQIGPLKSADKLIKEWEEDVADNKGKFTPQVRSQIQTELNKLKPWTVRLMKYRIGLSATLKDANIGKKMTDARDQVLEKKSTWKELADAADEWCKDVDDQLKGFEKELKMSAKVLNESVKKITKLASGK